MKQFMFGLMLGMGMAIYVGMTWKSTVISEDFFTIGNKWYYCEQGSPLGK